MFLRRHQKMDGGGQRALEGRHHFFDSALGNDVAGEMENALGVLFLEESNDLLLLAEIQNVSFNAFRKFGICGAGYAEDPVALSDELAAKVAADESRSASNKNGSGNGNGGMVVSHYFGGSNWRTTCGGDAGEIGQNARIKLIISML
jgi:hypothetical protein